MAGAMRNGAGLSALAESAIPVRLASNSKAIAAVPVGFEDVKLELPLSRIMLSTSPGYARFALL
jgi:hypothetical protein